MNCVIDGLIRWTEHPVIARHDYDGDTLTLTMFYGDALVKGPVNCRVMGLDCPEHKGTSLAASKHIVELSEPWLGRTPYLMAIQFDSKHDKDGRILIDLYHADEPADLFSRFLLDKKLAHVYDGHKKQEFTDAELAAILLVT